MVLPPAQEDIYNTGLIPLDPAEIQRSRKSITAKWISDIFSPPVLGAGCVILVAAELAIPGVWVWTLLFLALVVGIPTAYVFWLVRKGRVTDFHIPIRKQRVKPMIMMVSMGILGAGLMLALHAPGMYLWIMVIGLVQVMALFVITFKWKISGHALAVSSFCTLCGLFIGAFAWLTFLLVPLVIWSRLHLRRHTLLQTAAGTLLGLTMLTLSLTKLN